MTRTLFGGSPADVLAVVTTTDGDLAPLANTACTAWDAATGGTQLTDLQDSGGSSTSTVTTDALGRVLFYGPDPFAAPIWVQDASGNRWRIDPADLASRGAASLTSYVSSVEDLPDYPTAFPPSAHDHVAADITDFTGGVAAAITDPVGVDALGTALSDPVNTAAGDAVRALIQDYLAGHSFYPNLYIGASDPLPTNAPQGASLDILSGSVAGGMAATSYLAQAIAGGTTVAPTGTRTALGANAVVLALVSTSLASGTSTAPAPLPTAFTGLGLTWTQVTLPKTATFNGQDSVALYIGKGTGTTTNVSMTFASAPDNVHLRMVSLTAANGVVQQAASTAYATTNTTPTINLPGAVNTGTITLGWIVQNNASNAQTPGTGFTELASALSSTGMRTSGAYALPSRQSMSWTTATGYQKLMVLVEVS